jgi:dTDP-6-deoxy-L-talose 4-dehydrogenase (NAD+)
MTQLVLLTGATGFVGRQVYKWLISQKISVRIVVRKENVAQIEASECLESIVTTNDLFAESETWWTTVCTGVDTVIHLAWYAEPGKYLESVKNLDCVVGTLALAKGASSANIRRFIGVGTCFEYDLTQGKNITVDTPLNPLTVYAGAKVATYFSLNSWLSLRQIEFTWCRLFYLYGEGEDPRRLVAYIRKMIELGEQVKLTSGNQIRDFMDVSDAGEMIVKVALSNVQGQVNICSGVPITIKTLAERIADEYGRRDLLKFGARPENLMDPSFIVGVR